MTTFHARWPLPPAPLTRMTLGHDRHSGGRDAFVDKLVIGVGSTVTKGTLVRAERDAVAQNRRRNAASLNSETGTRDRVHPLKNLLITIAPICGFPKLISRAARVADFEI